MKVTREWIQENKSARNGWNFSQIAMLGESWPPKKGWIERAIGREISDEAAQKFVEYGQERPKKKERKKVKKSAQSEIVAEMRKEGRLQRIVRESREREKKKPKPAPKVQRVAYESTDAFLASYEWRRVRMEALKKHGARCQCCGASPADGVRMNVDHIKPRKLFPELALDVNNLQVLCEVCNHGKGNWDMTDWRGNEKVERADHG